MTKRAFLVVLLCCSAVSANSVVEKHKQAQQFVRHQHLLVAALRELMLQADSEAYCKVLSVEDCRQMKDDKKQLYEMMMREAGKQQPYSCEAYK